MNSIYDTVYALTIRSAQNSTDPSYSSIFFTPEDGGVRIVQFVDGKVSTNEEFIIGGFSYKQNCLISFEEARGIWNYLEGIRGYTRSSWARNP